jgi:hypothetical protein
MKPHVCKVQPQFIRPTSSLLSWQFNKWALAVRSEVRSLRRANGAHTDRQNGPTFIILKELSIKVHKYVFSWHNTKTAIETRVLKIADTTNEGIFTHDYLLLDQWQSKNALGNEVTLLPTTDKRKDFFIRMHSHAFLSTARNYNACHCHGDKLSIPLSSKPITALYVVPHLL